MPAPKAEPATKPAQAAKAAAPAAKPATTTGNYAVQVGAFSTESRANAAAKSVGGHVTKAGDLWRVRMGPFASDGEARRSEEHTSELQSLMRISYAVFCLKKKKTKKAQETSTTHTKLQQRK